MELEKYSGVVTAFSRKSIGARSTYEILEIDNNTLQNIRCHEKLDLYIKVGDDIDVWVVRGREILAVSRGDKIVVVGHKDPGGIMSFLFRLFTIPLMGLGVLFFWARNRLIEDFNLINTQSIPNYTEVVNLK